MAAIGKIIFLYFNFKLYFPFYLLKSVYLSVFVTGAINY